MKGVLSSRLGVVDPLVVQGLRAVQGLFDALSNTLASVTVLSFGAKAIKLHLSESNFQRAKVNQRNVAVIDPLRP
ncbi:hypothetical protein CKO39_14505 [Rhodopseudomonas palustris]|nr:hypothetical protein CKO39_14505 [Rhodopseudomonas palustris]